MNVHINADALVATPGCAHGEICHLRSYTRKRNKPLYTVWYVRVPFISQKLSGLLDVFGFEVVKANFVDEAVQSGGIEREDRFEIEALRCQLVRVWQSRSLTPGMRSCIPRMATAVTVSLVWLLSMRAINVWKR